MDDLVVNLEAPAPHRIRFGKTNRFTGIALDLSGEPIHRVSALLDGRIAAHTTVDRESPEIGRELSHVSGAERCRWAIELSVPKDADRLSFEVARADDSGQELFAVDLAELRRDQDRLLAMARAIDALPLPPPEIVALTQGHGDAAAYRESILPGVVNVRRYLERSGFASSRLRSVLNFGCGSGRLLAGWHADDPSRDLFGCDVHPALVGWARANLPAGIAVSQSSLAPPLAFPDARLDLVLAVTVFAGFELAGFFPSGRIGGERVLFPLAALQDVLVFWRLP